MTRVFTMAAVLAAATLAWADPPTEQAIQEITDLRAEVGPGGASPAEFAEALREVSEASQARPQAWTSDRPPTPPGPPTPLQYPGPTQPTDGWNRFGPPGPNTFVPSGPGRVTAQPGFELSGQDVFMPVQPGTPPMAPPPPPGPPHERPRDPKNLLRRSAAELDRLANELEVAELYAESDALREAAGRLRRSARAAKGPAPAPPQGGAYEGFAPPPRFGEPPHPPRHERHAGPPMPGPAEAPPREAMEHLRARVKNAMADAKRRQAELEAKLHEAEEKMRRVEAKARAAEAEAMQAKERGRAAQEEARRALERRERELRRRTEEQERRFRGRGDDDDDGGETRLFLPPRGIYGGPTEPATVVVDLLPMPVD